MKKIFKDRKFWVAILCLYQVVMARGLIDWVVEKRGILSDIIVFLFSFFILAILPNKKVWKILGVLFAFIFCLLSLINVVYFSFYHTIIHFDLIYSIRDLLGIGPSLAQLITLKIILQWIVVPFVLVFVIYNTWNINKSKKICSYVIFVVLIISIVFLNVWNYYRPPDFSIRDMNYGVYITSQFIDKIFKKNNQSQKNILIQEATQRAREIFSILDNYEYSNIDLRPIHKKVSINFTEDYSKKNLVLIVMESIKSTEVGTYGSKFSVTPNLDSLAKKSIVFDSFYANGSQTAHGEMAINCSVLPYHGGGLVYINHPYLNVMCLAEILKNSGYSTNLFIGCEESFSQKGLFERNHGFDNVYDISSYPKPIKKIGMGIRDEDMFKFAIEKIKLLEKPFFAEIVTLSGHHPFSDIYPVDAPVRIDGSSDIFQKYRHGVRYTDHVVGLFMDEMEKIGLVDDTIFAFVTDHGVWFFEDEKISPIEKVESYFRIPFIIYGKHIAPANINIVSSQIDVAPTLLGLLGIYADNSFMGKNLLSLNIEEGLALLVHENSWNIRHKDKYCYNVGQSCFRNLVPKCPVGTYENSDKYSCFKSSTDILFDFSEENISILNDTERSRLLIHGKDMVQINNMLIDFDAF